MLANSEHRAGVFGSDEERSPSTTGRRDDREQSVDDTIHTQQGARLVANNANVQQGDSDAKGTSLATLESTEDLVRSDSVIEIEGSL